MKKFYFLITTILLGSMLVYGAIDRPRKIKKDQKINILQRSKSKISQNRSLRLPEALKLKSVNANDIGQTYYVADSIAYLNEFDELYAYEKHYYSEMGYLLKKYYYEYSNTLKNFIVLETVELEWDENGKITDYELYLADEQTSKLVGAEKESYKYDGKGREIEYIEYVWNGVIDDWQEYYKESKTYNNDDDIDEMIKSGWNIFEEKWLNEVKLVYSYDSTAKLQLVNEYSWDNNWNSSYKDTSIYENNLLKHWISYEYNSDSATWTAIAKEYFTYNEADDITEWYSEFLDDSDNWMKEYKDQIEYDENGFITKVLLLIWPEEGDSWVGTNKNEFEYDAKGNQTQKIEWVFNFDEPIGWLPVIKINTSYDDNDELETESKFYLWDSDVNNKGWYYIGKYHIYYNDHTSLLLGLPVLDNDIKLKLYPNPFTSILNIELASKYIFPGAVYQIINSIGNEVAGGNITMQNQQVFLDHIEPGIYILKIEAGSKEFTRKLIKK